MEGNINTNFNEEINVWEVKLIGEFDIFNSSELREALTNLINEKKANIHIHCDELAFFDSTAIGTLVSIYNIVAKYNGKIVLYNLHANIMKLLRITNLDKVFVIKVGATNE